MIQSQRLRRAITCLKRKERGEDEGEGEDTESPDTSKKGTHRMDAHGNTREEGGVMSGGGFLGSQVITETPLREVGSTPQESPSEMRHVTKAAPQRIRRKSSSSSGGDSDGNGDVSMVTARSVFKSNSRGRNCKSTRGRGRGRGRGKKK